MLMVRGRYQNCWRVRIMFIARPQQCNAR